MSQPRYKPSDILASKDSDLSCPSIQSDTSLPSLLYRQLRLFKCLIWPAKIRQGRFAGLILAGHTSLGQNVYGMAQFFCFCKEWLILRTHKYFSYRNESVVPNYNQFYIFSNHKFLRNFESPPVSQTDLSVHLSTKL